MTPLCLIRDYGLSDTKHQLQKLTRHENLKHGGINSAFHFSLKLHYFTGINRNQNIIGTILKICNLHLSTRRGEGGQKSLKSCLRSLCKTPYILCTKSLKLFLISNFLNNFDNF